MHDELSVLKLVIRLRVNPRAVAAAALLAGLTAALGGVSQSNAIAGVQGAGAETIDLRPLTAIPGLIDAHTHMTYFWDGATGTTPLNQPRREPAQARRVGVRLYFAHP